MTLDEPGFDAFTFSQNRARLIRHEVAVIFFNKVYAIAQRNKWASDDHFSADGTPIAAWGSMKSFRSKDESPEDGDSNGFAGFKGTKPPELHARERDRSRRATPAQVQGRGTALPRLARREREPQRTAPSCASRARQCKGNATRIRPKTMGGDAGYHTEAFVEDMRAMESPRIPRCTKRAVTWA